MKKIIIMGLAQTGKTTIVKVTAEGMAPPKIAEYSATLDYKRKTYVLFGTKISMFDLGGQKSFLDRFIGDLAEFIFTNVSTLIFVIDVVNMDKISLAKYYFDMGKKTLKKFSPNANIAVFLHKMDLIDQKNKTDFIASVKEFLELETNIKIFETNIFDKSIFEAMKNVVIGESVEPESLEGKINKFSYDLADFLDLITVIDRDGNTIVTNNKENQMDVKIFIEIKNKYESMFREGFTHSFSQLNTKLIFYSILNNDHKLIIIYSTNDLQIMDKNYKKLIEQSIQVLSDLNQFIT